MLSGHVPTQVQEGGDMVLAAGTPPRVSAPPLSFRAPPSSLVPLLAPHVGKFLPQACHLEAEQRGVVEAEQFPQREQHWRAVSALL